MKSNVFSGSLYNNSTNRILVITPANVAINAPHRVYLDFVTFTLIK